MLFDLTSPCYLTTFSGKKCLSGKVICAFFCPAHRSSPVLYTTIQVTIQVIAESALSSQVECSSHIQYTALQVTIHQQAQDGLHLVQHPRWQPCRRQPPLPARLHARPSQRCRRGRAPCRLAGRGRRGSSTGLRRLQSPKPL
jgi:hypothetical protein